MKSAIPSSLFSLSSSFMLLLLLLQYNYCCYYCCHYIVAVSLTELLKRLLTLPQERLCSGLFYGWSQVCSAVIILTLISDRLLSILPEAAWKEAGASVERLCLQERPAEGMPPGAWCLLTQLSP